MRKGNVRILLLMLFVIAGLILAIFLMINSSTQSEKTANSPAQGEGILLTQMQNRQVSPEDRQAFQESLDKYRRMVTNLEQTDIPKFKTQSRDAFLGLASLIDDLKKQTEGTASTGAAAPATEDQSEEMQEPEDNTTADIRTNAGRIPEIQDENELVTEIKSTFNAARESLEEIEADENATSAAGTEEEMEDKFEQRFDDLEQKINALTQANYRAGSKEIFLNFHSLIKQMENELYKMQQPMAKPVK